MSIPNLARLTCDTHAPSNAHAPRSNTSFLDLPPELKNKILLMIHNESYEAGTNACDRMRNICKAHPQMCDENICKKLCASFRYNTEEIRDAFLLSCDWTGSVFDAARALRDHPWRLCFFELCKRCPVEQSQFKRAINTTQKQPGCLQQLYGHISFCDVSQVTNMNSAFKDKYSFNENLSLWDVSNVRNMDYMFYNAEHFDKAHLLNEWNVSNVKKMNNVFGSARAPYSGRLPGWYTQPSS